MENAKAFFFFLFFFKKAIIYVHSRDGKEETGDADVITSVHRVLSIFSVSKDSFVYVLLYFSSFCLLQCLKKGGANLLDWQASESCVTARRRCPEFALMPSREARADF